MRRRAVIDQEDVQATATRIVFDIGLHAVTPEAVAEALGTKVQAVLAHEPDFDVLVAEVFRRAVAAELAEVKRAALVHPDPLDQLRSLVVLLAEPVHVEVTAAWTEAFSLGRTNTALGAMVRSEMESWQRFIVGVLQRGARAGAWTSERPEAVAAHLLAMIDGVNAYALVAYENGIVRSEMLETIVFHGLGIRLSATDRSAV